MRWVGAGTTRRRPRDRRPGTAVGTRASAPSRVRDPLGERGRAGAGPSHDRGTAPDPRNPLRAGIAILRGDASARRHRAGRRGPSTPRPYAGRLRRPLTELGAPRGTVGPLPGGTPRGGRSPRSSRMTFREVFPRVLRFSRARRTRSGTATGGGEPPSIAGLCGGVRPESTTLRERSVFTVLFRGR